MGNFKNELRAWQQIPRKLINDNSLSDRARFVYCFMACKPDDWDFYMEPLAKDLGYSVDTLRKYITELINSGWLTKGEQDHVVVGEGKKQLFGAKKYTLHAEKVPRDSDTEKVRHGKRTTLHDRDYEHNRDDEDKEEKEDVDAWIDKMYSIYPTKCPCRNMQLGKCSKDKERIRKLLKSYTKEQIEKVIRNEVDTKYGKSYMMNFSTFLNNFPDPNCIEFSVCETNLDERNNNVVIKGVEYR